MTRKYRTHFNKCAKRSKGISRKRRKPKYNRRVSGKKPLSKYYKIYRKTFKRNLGRGTNDNLLTHRERDSDDCLYDSDSVSPAKTFTGFHIRDKISRALNLQSNKQARKYQKALDMKNIQSKSQSRKQFEYEQLPSKAATDAYNFL